MNWIKNKLLCALMIGSLAIIPSTVSGESSDTQVFTNHEKEIAKKSWKHGGRRHWRGHRRHHRGFRPYRYNRPYYYYPYYRNRYYYNDPYYYYYDQYPQSGVYFQFGL